LKKDRADAAESAIQIERKRIHTVEETLNETRGMSSSVEEERDAFKAKLDKAAKELRLETDRADVAERDFQDEKTKVREVRRKLDEELDHTDKLEEDLLRHKSKIGKLEQEIFQQKEVTLEKEAELAKSDQDASKLGKLIKSLQDQLAEVKLAHEKTQTELDRANKHIADLEKSPNRSASGAASGSVSDEDRHKLLKASRDLDLEREKASTASEQLKREKSRTNLLEEEMSKLSNEIKRLRVSEARKSVGADALNSMKRAEEQRVILEEQKVAESKLEERQRRASIPPVVAAPILERYAEKHEEKPAEKHEEKPSVAPVVVAEKPVEVWKPAEKPAEKPAAAPEPEAAPTKCWKCNAPLRANTKFCVKCGARTDSPPVAKVPAPAPSIFSKKVAVAPVTGGGSGNCPKCKKALKPGAKFCASCGQRIT